MWKILIAQIKEKIYYALISRGIFHDEQKGCRKRTCATEELLYIFLHILNESKTGGENLAIAWICFPKAGYYTVSKCKKKTRPSKPGEWN